MQLPTGSNIADRLTNTLQLAATDSSKEFSSIAEQVKANNDIKRDMRELRDALRDGDMDFLHERLDDAGNDLARLGESLAFELQTAATRVTQAETAASQFMKKYSDAADQVIRNI